MKPVWIVDDDKSIRWVLEKTLAREQIPFKSFQSASEALSQLDLGAEPPQVLVSDIRMPGISGVDLFFKLRKADPFLQIIIISAYPDLATISRMLEAGATDYIVKPFKMEYLKEIVLETFSKIERWRNLRQEILKRREKKTV